jgi:AcrR family transcriptional regulator
MNSGKVHMVEEVTPELSRRERKKTERKERIFNAAIDVFAEKGFRNATIKDIAEAADVGEGTIYSYYASKDDLLMAIIDELSQLKLRNIFAAEGLEVDYKEWTYRQFIENAERFRGPATTMYLAVLPELLSNPQLRDGFYKSIQATFAQSEAYLTERIERGHIRPLDPALTARILASIGMGWQFLMLMGDPLALEMIEEPEGFARTMVEIVFDGLRR